MNKRELSHNEEEKLPGNNTVKKVKGSQGQEIPATNTSLSPPRQRQTQTTNSFRINPVTNWSAQETEEEQEAPSFIEKQARITEIILDSDSDASYYSQDEDAEVINPTNQKINLRRMPNVMFYLNMISSQPQGDYVNNIHTNWKNDYKKLEIHHGYIQWLFPNFYLAPFNKDSSKLTNDEARIFRENKEIAERLVKSYELILGFFGMILADRLSGKLERAANFEERYRSTLIASSQNHLRIKRILAHLNIVGLRQYAIELVNFLETEMFGEKGGYNKYQLQQKPIKSEYLKALRSNPLFPLIKHDIFKDWKVYGQAETAEEKEHLFKFCYTSDERDFEPSVLFKH